MTSTLQRYLRGIFTTDHSPGKLTNPVDDFFTQAVTAVGDFFRYIIGFFNQVLPPETRDEHIHHLLDVAMPYLIVTAVLIVSAWLFRCIAAILIGCFNVVRRFFRFIGRCLCCGGRTMKAPGRSSERIQRDAFQDNPRAYFRGLRGKSD
ncbi:hypothetical protein L6452_20731 [Arctium lappa]|uniref:Uncharacterized protein n=1 Tax=Arctium lappa TaxID=4217 RepID=A0ACB9BC72_ARCLA|nr:hypothetical protein L6452_20731 [Arctium lappa]